MGRRPRDAGKESSHVVRRDDLFDEEGVESGTVLAATTPTQIPPAFDPRAFTEESEVRERAPTLTDADATEQARVASLLMQTRPPPPRASAPEVATFVESVGTLSDDEEVVLLREALEPLTRIPSLAKSLTELGSLLEDPKTAYVLGFVDGVLPLETIIEVTGLPEVDTLRILDRVERQGVIVFRRPRGGRSSST